MQTTTTTCAELDAAISAYEAARRHFPGAVEDALERVHDRTGAILSSPATSLHAVKLKARALSWELDGVTPETFRADHIALDAIRGLLADVAALR